MLTYHRIRHEIDWQLQNLLTWSASYRMQSSSASQCTKISRLDQQRFQLLDEQYDIKSWPEICAKADYHYSLYLLDLLHHYLGAPDESQAALDIGCGSWQYLPALHAFQPTQWLGIELDAHRRFFDMTTRHGRAKSMLRHFPSARYRATSLNKVEQQFDLITWFLPFVLPKPLYAHGLPRRFFQPEQLLNHAISLLSNTGKMLIMNQGEEEFREQLRLLESKPVTIQASEQASSPFNPYEQPFFITVIQKHAQSDKNTPAEG